MRDVAAGFLCGIGFFSGSMGLGLSSADTPPAPTMAPLSSYLETGGIDEVSVARSAAPQSISANAEVLTLGSHGYVTAVKGSNGFVCLVERSWAVGYADPGFWSSKFRAPTCYNRAAARSVLPRYLRRTEWALAGASTSEMLARTRAELSANKFVFPEAGAMAYMMSKQTHLNDTDGHWHPHLMFYLANTEAASWGANLPGSPVFADNSTIFAQKDIAEPVITFFVPVPKWSDGTQEHTETH